MFVYILFSVSRQKYYVGQASNVEKRLDRHNTGKVRSTKGGEPWELVWSRKVGSRSEALILERKIKKRGAKRFLEDIGAL